MTINNSALRLLVGEELGLADGNMPLTTDVDDKINRRLSGVRAWLLSENLCFWPDDAIPEAVKLPLAQIVAQQCCESIGSRGANSEDPYQSGASGFAALERHCAVRSAHEPVQAEYF